MLPFSQEAGVSRLDRLVEFRDPLGPAAKQFLPRLQSAFLVEAPEAAELMRITAPDLLRLGVIDGIVPEPIGGAHRNWEETAENLRGPLRDALWELRGNTPEELVALRYEKFRKIGVFEESA